MVTLALSCSKKQGSTKGEDLAISIETMIKNHGLTGHVVVCNTDLRAVNGEGGSHSHR